MHSGISCEGERFPTEISQWVQVGRGFTVFTNNNLLGLKMTSVLHTVHRYTIDKEQWTFLPANCDRSQQNVIVA